MPTGHRSARAARQVPKLCGADVELGNFTIGVEDAEASGALASRALLRQIDGVPHTHPSAHAPYAYGAYGASSWGGARWGYDPQDVGRKFLRSGGCCYIDLAHLEICTPEVRSAFDHVAAWHAMLRVARAAQRAANARLPPGQRIQVLVNNSDGQSNSYGAHLSFLITRRARQHLFSRRLHYLLLLGSFQASSIVLTGLGKVGAENGAPAVDFQISQRADFFATLIGEQTTYNRPLVNTRDEALCGAHPTLARLHCIFYDATLCHVSSLLKVGLMQIALAMLEAERADARLVLEDPVDAVRRWSHDPTLRTRARLVTGARLTAVELQLLLCEQATRFAETGGLDGVVPRAGEILALWQDSLIKLRGGDLPALAARLDWVLKRQLLERVLQQHPRLTWRSPALKHLDLLYSSLDPGEGLYWPLEASGAVERVVDDARIAQFVDEPPDDTRAWTRAMLLRRLAADQIYAVDWDAVTVVDDTDVPTRRYRRLELADPRCGGRAEAQMHFDAASSDGDLLRRLGAAPTPDPLRARTGAEPWHYRTQEDESHA